MGIAFHAYHDAKGHFPKGGTHLPPTYPSSANISANTPLEREESWSWAYLLLPYIEQDNLFKTTDCAALRSTPVKIYYCPSRRAPQHYYGTAKIDYAGSVGDKSEGQNGLVMRTIHGVVRIADVTDGTSSTMMLGEKQLNRAMFGESADDNESFCTPGWNGDWEVYRWGAEPPGPDFSAPGEIAPSRIFGSAHVSGFTSAFADGSVHFIRYSVTATTWRRACVRDDNQAVNLNDL